MQNGRVCKGSVVTLLVCCEVICATKAAEPMHQLVNKQASPECNAMADHQLKHKASQGARIGIAFQ